MKVFFCKLCIPSLVKIPNSARFGENPSSLSISPSPLSRSAIAVSVVVTSLEMDRYEGESWRPANREGSIFFPAEGWRRGEPELRPEVGRCVLRRTAGMYRLEEKLRGHALVGTVEGNRPPVSPAQVVAALEAQCGVRREDVMVEVCSPPADFLVRFQSGEDCTRVLIYQSRKLTVGG